MIIIAEEGGGYNYTQYCFVRDIFCGKLIFQFNLNMKVPELLLLRLRVVAELVVASAISGLCWIFPHILIFILYPYFKK